MTATHAKLQAELEASKTAISSHHSSVEDAKHAHESATTALADLRAAREVDEVVVADLKRELLDKEHLLAQAMTDLQKTSQIEADLREREEEIEKVKTAHERDLAALRESISGQESSNKDEHDAQIKVCFVRWSRITAEM
jgi:chromosome segregation ATPase